MKLISAQIMIFIPGQNYVTQGKVCEFSGKPSYVATMTAAKWFRNYSGYAISQRVITAFKDAKFNPVIVYDRPDLNTYYTTTRGMFIKKGVLVGYGGHSQYVLPISNWKAHEGHVVVPKDFPCISLDEWKRKTLAPPLPEFPPEPVIEDVTVPDEVRLKLRENFYAKFPEMRRATNG